MADYSQQNPRDYGQRQHGPVGSNQQHEAAYANMYSGHGSSRSQTMTSHSYQPYSAGGAQTMSNQSMNQIPRDPRDRDPRMRQAPNGYSSPNHASQSSQQYPVAQPNYTQRQPQPQSNPYPPQGASRQQQSNYQPQSQYQQQQYQQQRQYQQTSPQQQQQSQQYANYPQREQSRNGSMGHQAPPNIPPSTRYYSAQQQMNPDPYARSQSLASHPRPQIYPPSAPQGYNNNMAPAQAVRQQQYNHISRTTASGRIVPERGDERSMSMSSYARESETNQTMSGRVIPNRKRESHETISTLNNDRDSQSSMPPSPTALARQRSDSQNSVATVPSRTFSMASTITDGQGQGQQPLPKVVTQRRNPLVYPALLSRVADAFKDHIAVADLQKDGLDYKSAFTGEEAVVTIAYIIKTTDRNLALLLGRSLDAQKFFHDVTYAHRLRDSRQELYQFRDPLVEGDNEVNGVFIILTECYSPTCTRDKLCYSIACPRRLEQQARLKMRPQPGLKRADSHTSLHEDASDEQKLWINTVSKEVADSVSDKEKKRQEVISELSYTERDFVKDLEYMRDFWIKPLKTRNAIPEHRKEKFIKSVFSNLSEIYNVNSKLAEQLTRRQQEDPVVSNVGDIFLQHVPKFNPFITYGASQLFGKHEFENERKLNPAFTKFVEETERLKESRKLELNGYLTKPTTRLARYPLLLEAILKYTADDNPDKQDIPKAIVLIKEFLSKVNAESGKAENHFAIVSLNRELKFRPGEHVDLKLNESHRQLIFKGMLKRAPQDQQGDIQVYVFDHAVLLVRIKTVNKKEDLKVFRKPIPLELLTIAEMGEVLPRGIGMIRRPATALALGVNQAREAKPGYPITFECLGKDGYKITLYCSTQIQQQKLIEHIDSQQQTLMGRANIYTKTVINQGFFTSIIRVNCCVPIDGGLKLVLGTEAGVFVLDRKNPTTKPRRVLDCKNVTGIDVLEQYQILLVLADKTLYSYSTEALDPDDNVAANSKRGRKICHANFFKAGICSGQQFVCPVKTTALSTTVKVYEPMDVMAKKSKKSGLAKMLANNQDVLKLLKEIFIPAESAYLHFLRTKLCICCTRGFELVSLETLEAQSLLDEADTSLDFVQRKEVVKPVHIERIAGEFLLCYTDCSFFVNRDGWRVHHDWLIKWQGTPNAFAVHSPFILAFEPNFIEIRNLETSSLVHIITAKNIRMLHYSSREILYTYEDDEGVDVIASLDLWTSLRSQEQTPQQQQRSLERQPLPTKEFHQSPPGRQYQGGGGGGGYPMPPPKHNDYPRGYTR